ncbi:MAG TPA: NAD(P)-dependent oxidoreductase, partial [Acidimicrobiales bacterium]|nr:NAD(P)-dependent oxidoreductase [Acidimicrobiales bacterium]
MRVVVIGATGHIGSYLVPRLVSARHEVLVLSRGERSAYHDDPAWKVVERVEVDRVAEDAAGTFASRVASYGADAVVDLICFTRSSAAQLAEALRGRPTLLLHCGTIWVHGPAVEVPATEDLARRPLEEYGREKAAIEELLLGETAAGRLRAILLHPGHIVGPGWPPLNPAGHFDPAVFATLAAGAELALPNLGLETVHHVHADDVAQAFELALAAPAAVGEAFHVTSERALTLRGYAEAVAAWFGNEALLAFLPWEEWRASVSEEDAEATWSHISHSQCMSIEKARRILGYEPGYTSLEA